MEKLTIGKLANSAGINLETVRYYERIGLMPEPGRTEKGHRNYAAAHLRRLTFIRRARELGFAIEDIRALLALAEPGRVSCGEVQKIAPAIFTTSGQSLRISPGWNNSSPRRSGNAAAVALPRVRCLRCWTRLRTRPENIKR